MTERIPVDGVETEALASRLAADGVRMVALSLVDNAGITRVKTVPAPRLAHAATYGIGVSPCFETFAFDDMLSTGRYLGGPDGDLRLIPDLSRLTALECQPGWGWAPADKFTQEGTRFVACQRAFAARQVSAARDAGLQLKVAFEHEWSLGADSAEFVPAVDGPGYGIIRLGQVSDYVLDLVAALDRQGVTVEQFHPEYALSQMELSVASADPVAAADDAVLVRHTIRQVSRSHGWRATLAPCIDPDGPGSGGHLHLSVQDESGSLMAGGEGRYGLRPVGEAFLAGVLRELPALVAIGAGNPASFLRLQPSRWAGAWQSWGRETREAALRFITGVTGTGEWAANAEIKCFDATGNPYLVVGGVIAAGLAGVADELQLPPEVTGDPAGSDEPPARLPTSSLEAAQCLEQSTVLSSALGVELHDAIVTVRRDEGERYADVTSTDLVALTRWRF